MIGSEIDGGENLDDPAVLAKVARDLAGGMEQQSQMAATGTAMTGHPSPSWFYGRVADVLRRCAAAVGGALPTDRPVTTAAPPASLTIADTSPEALARPDVDDEGVPVPPAETPRRNRGAKAKAGDPEPVG